MQFDYFIVWPYGIQYLEGILDIIREYDELEVVYVRYFVPENFNQFVEDLYKLDTVPIEHLRAKSKYLIDSGREIFLIVVKNHNPMQRMVGEGEYRHEQGLLMNEVKWRIREEYNPRLEDGRRSEDHVIHGSDYQSQTEEILKMIPSPTLSDFTKNEGNKIKSGWHVGVGEYKLKTVDLSKLDIMLADHGGNHKANIKESPHYKFLQGDEEPYKKYWIAYRGQRNTSDHTSEGFKAMAKDFLYLAHPYQNHYIVISDNVIIDGVHRACILLSRGENKIKVCQI